LNILAIDPATHCGWAFGDGRTHVSGTWDLSTRRDESSGMKLIRLRAKLEHFVPASDVVVFEAARHSAPGMQGALVHQARLQSVIEMWCEDRGVEYRGYSPSEIKKFATGKGNAGKPAVVAAVESRWGAVADDNEADAVALLYLAHHELGSEQCPALRGAEAATP